MAFPDGTSPVKNQPKNRSAERYGLMGGLGALIVAAGSLLLFFVENWASIPALDRTGLLIWFLLVGGLFPMTLGLLAGLLVGLAAKKLSDNDWFGTVTAVIAGGAVAYFFAWILWMFFA